jgi:tripartite-type tricarboxylate transporter receptor subunit TctC
MDGMKKKHGVDWVYVPYRSGNEVVNAIVSGATPIAILGLANMLGQLRSGLITGIALNANARSPLFPDLPTLSEAGADDFPPAWFGLFAPRGTPKPMIAKLHSEIVRIAAEPAWRQKNFIDRAIEPAVNTPEQFSEFIRRERKIAERIVKESGHQPQ